MILYGSTEKRYDEVRYVRKILSQTRSVSDAFELFRAGEKNKLEGGCLRGPVEIGSEGGDYACRRRADGARGRGRRRRTLKPAKRKLGPKNEKKKKNLIKNLK